MFHIYSPIEFLNISITLEILFSLITLAVAIYAFKVYNMSYSNRTRNFGLAFLLVSFSYISMAMLNRFAFDSFTDFQKSLSLYQLTKTFSLVYLGIYTHAIFFILGISILLYLTFKKQDKRLLMLIILISLVPIFTLNQFYLAKYLITSLLLFFIIGGYLEEHKTNKRVKLVLVAFILLLVGNVALIFTAENFLFYILGNLLEFIAYSIVLIDLMIIIRKKPSKKIP